MSMTRRIVSANESLVNDPVSSARGTFNQPEVRTSPGKQNYRLPEPERLDNRTPTAMSQEPANRGVGQHPQLGHPSPPQQAPDQRV